MCRAAHLIERGAAYGLPEADLRAVAVDLGIVGVTEGGQRYIGLPSVAQQLEHWVKWCTDVVGYHRNNEELERGEDPMPFDDELPISM